MKKGNHKGLSLLTLNVLICERKGSRKLGISSSDLSVIIYCSKSESCLILLGHYHFWSLKMKLFLDNSSPSYFWNKVCLYRMFIRSCGPDSFYWLLNKHCHKPFEYLGDQDEQVPSVIKVVKNQALSPEIRFNRLTHRIKGVLNQKTPDINWKLLTKPRLS